MALIITKVGEFILIKFIFTLAFSFFIGSNAFSLSFEPKREFFQVSSKELKVIEDKSCLKHYGVRISHYNSYKNRYGKYVELSCDSIEAIDGLQVKNRFSCHKDEIKWQCGEDETEVELYKLEKEIIIQTKRSFLPDIIAVIHQMEESKQLLSIVKRLDQKRSPHIITVNKALDGTYFIEFDSQYTVEAHSKCDSGGCGYFISSSY